MDVYHRGHRSTRPTLVKGSGTTRLHGQRGGLPMGEKASPGMEEKYLSVINELAYPVE